MMKTTLRVGRASIKQVIVPWISDDLRITLSGLSKRSGTRGNKKCLDKGNHNPPSASFMKLQFVVLLIIGLISLCMGLYACLILSWCLLPSSKSIDF